MKISRKLASVLVVCLLTMGMSTLAVQGVGETNTVLFNENFNDFTADVSPEISNPACIVKTATNSKVTIQKDNLTNSKGVKIQTPHGEMEDTGVKFKFEPVTSGIVKFDFKLRAEVNSAIFSNFSIGNETDNKVKFMQIKNDIFILNDWGGWCSNLEGNYYHYVITLNLDTNKYDVTVNDVLVQKDKIARSASVKEVSNISFFASANYNALGGAASWVKDIPDDAIYWIDDVKIERESVKVTSTTPTNGYKGNNIDNLITVSMNSPLNKSSVNNSNFLVYDNETLVNPTDYSVATDANNQNQVNITLNNAFKGNHTYKVVVKSGINSTITSYLPMSGDYTFKFDVLNKNTFVKEDFNEPINYSNWKFETADANSTVSVDMDSLTNSKALKILSHEGTTNNTGVKIAFEPISTGKIKFDFKLRTQNNSARISKFSIGNDASSRVSFLALKETIYCESGRWQDHSCTNIKGNYQHFNIEIDMDNKVYDVTIDGVKKHSNLAFKTQGDTISNFELYVSSNINGLAPSWLGDDKGDSIYWIDDINFTKEYINVSSASVVNGNIECLFSQDVKNNSVNYNNFEMYKNDVKLSVEDYILRAENPKKIVIELKNKLSYDDKYKLVVKSGLSAQNSSYGTLLEDYTYNIMLKSENVIINDDFSKFTDGDSPSTVYNKWDIKTAQGRGSVSVKTDALTQNQAIKIVEPKGELEAGGVKVNFEPVTMGKVKFDFKFREENNSARLNRFTIGGTSNHAMWIWQYKDSLFYETTANYLTDIKGGYKHFEIVMDVTNNMYNITVDDVTKVKNQPFSNANNDISYLMLTASSDLRECNSNFLGTDNGDSIYWLDDLKVTSYDYPELKAASVVNGATNIPLDKELSFEYDRALEPSTVTKENVLVYNNNVILDNTQYDVSYVSATNSIKVSITNGLQYDNAYRVILGTGICGTNFTKCKNSYTYNFTAQSNPNAILSLDIVGETGVIVSDLTEYAGKSVKVKATINKNVSNYTFIATLSTSGRVVTINTIDFTKVQNNAIELTLNIPTNVSINDTIDCYLWNAQTLEPLCNKQSGFKKK